MVLIAHTVPAHLLGGAQGKADTFVFKMADLGDLSELEVWHDNSGLGPGWHLDFVEVHSSATGKVRGQRTCACRSSTWYTRQGAPCWVPSCERRPWEAPFGLRKAPKQGSASHAV